jgi:nucleoside-diphosphate-sugar epimerase
VPQRSIVLAVGQGIKMWKSKKCLVTGGASFIGSHLTHALLTRGADVRVADNLSSGKKSQPKQCRVGY